DGSFRFEGLRVETYQISASLETPSADPVLIESPTVDVKAGTRELVLRLRASAILSGRVVTPEGAPVVPAEVMAVDLRDDWSENTVVDSSGAFSIRVPAGDPIELRAWHRANPTDDPDAVAVRAGGRAQDPPQAVLKNLHGGDADV